jgi:hypothetical protein
LTTETGGPVSLKEAREYVAEQVWPMRKRMVDWERRNNIKK